MKNSEEVEGKEQDLLFKAFSLCPYHYNVSARIFIRYEEERKNIFQIAKKYKNDLTPMLKWVIKSMYTDESKSSEVKAQEAKTKIKNFMQEYNITEDETLDELEYDCLVRLSTPYKNSIPGENQSLIDSIVSYDASDNNKSIVVEEFRIWELADNYGVEFDYEEKELIVSTFIKWAKNKNNLDKKTILHKVMFIMNGLQLQESVSRDDFEYSILEELSSEYERLPVGEADEIIQRIIESFVSDSTKSKYIHDKDIWELFPQYHVGFTKEERFNILYRIYQKIQTEKNISDDEIKDKLYFVIKSFVSTETIEPIFDSIKKSDLFIRRNIVNAAKDQFVRINLYGKHTFKFEEINDWGNKKTYEREDSFWVVGDKEFDDLYDGIKKCFKSNTQVSDYEDVFLILATNIDSKSQLHTFFSYKKAYCMGYSGEIYDIDLNNFKSVNDIGNLSLLDGTCTLGFFTKTGLSKDSMHSIATVINNIVAHIISLMNEKNDKLFQLEKYYNQIRSLILSNISDIKNYREILLPEKDLIDKFYLAQIIERMSIQRLIMADDNEIDSLVLTLDTANIGAENQKILLERLNAMRLVKAKHRKDIESLYLESGSHIPQMIYKEFQLIETSNNTPTGFIFDPCRIDKITKELTSIKLNNCEKIYLIWTDPKYVNLDSEQLLAGFKFILTNLRLIIRVNSISVRSLEEIKLSILGEIVIKMGSNSYKFATTMFSNAKKIVASINNCILEIKKNEIATSAKNQLLANRYVKMYQECFDNYPLPNEEKKNMNSLNGNTYIVSEPKIETINGIFKWMCGCGNINTGNFCSQCGSKKENGIALWTYTCGSINKGKFCPKCGLPKKED